jgi:hypothetical protein
MPEMSRRTRLALLITARDGLQQTRGLASVLDAACDAFEDILAVIGNYEETTTSTRHGYRLPAGGHASRQRPTRSCSPSRCRPRSLRPRRAPERPDQESADDIRAAVVDLSMLLASQLADTAATAAADGNRAACCDAACVAGRRLYQVQSPASAARARVPRSLPVQSSITRRGQCKAKREQGQTANKNSTRL